MTRWVALLAVAAFACGRPEIHRGPCRFSASARVVTLAEGRVVDWFQAVASQSDPDPLLVVTNATAGGFEAARIDCMRGRQTTTTIPIRFGESPSTRGYSFFSGGDHVVLDPLLQHGVVRVAMEGRHFTRRSLGYSEKWHVVGQTYFSGVRRILFGRVVLLSQDVTNVPHDEGMRDASVQLEPGGDRVVCFCNDDRGTHVALFSRRALTRLEPAAARAEAFASYAGELSTAWTERSLTVTPMIRVTRRGTYRVRLRMRNAQGRITMAFAVVTRDVGTWPVPVRFDRDAHLDQFGAPPYEIYAIEVGEDSPAGEVLLDQHFGVWRVSQAPAAPGI